MIIVQLDSEQLSSLIQNAVRKAIGETTNSTPQFNSDFKYIPIQDIFKKKICSKPTFYAHLKAGDFTLYKFGNKSFVDLTEFQKAFHRVKLNYNKNKGISSL